MPEQMITAEDIAAGLRVSRNTIHRAARAGLIPSTAIGRTLRFDPSVIDLLKRDGVPSRPAMEALASRPRWCGRHRCDTKLCPCADVTG